MKKKVFILSFALIILNLSFILAGSCNLDVSLINQDPYPAIPGDYVKLVFQINGVENPLCGQVDFELLEKYPLSFDPNENPKISIAAGTYDKDYSSFLLAPYKVRVDSNALDGDNPIEVQYKYASNEDYETKTFELNIGDTRADFEIHVKDYVASTRTLTLEILNIGEDDIEALTVEIPKQDNIEIKGPKANIVGDLDSNEYTTADFEAIPSEGEITIKLSYTDSINERRIVEKKVLFEPEYFEGRIADQKKPKLIKYLVWIILAGLLIYYFLRKRKKKKLHKKRHK